jgi:hypothetical protein
MTTKTKETHPNSLAALESEAARAGRVHRWTHGAAADWAHTWKALRARIPADLHIGLERKLYLFWLGVAADDRRPSATPPLDADTTKFQGTLWDTCEPYV